jgi:O-6-methylguanine DNA methyltransferase
VHGDGAVAFVGFPGSRPSLRRYLERQGLEPREDPRTCRALRAQLDEYLRGERTAFDLELRAHGTPFQQLVWRALADIPFGETRSYQELADRIGRPTAVRAVARANALNPIPILIPCHRVVRTDGTIGRYAWGTEMKRELLEHEGLDPDEIESTAQRGVRVVGSDTTRIYCYPTCRHARRASTEHEVEFRSARAAEDAGYRACKVCRPAA